METMNSIKITPRIIEEAVRQALNEFHGSIVNEYFPIAKYIVDTAYRGVQTNGVYKEFIDRNKFAEYNCKIPQNGKDKKEQVMGVCPSCGCKLDYARAVRYDEKSQAYKLGFCDECGCSFEESLNKNQLDILRNRAIKAYLKNLNNSGIYVIADADTNKGSYGSYGNGTLRLHFNPKYDIKEYYTTVIHEFTHAKNSQASNYNNAAIASNKNANSISNTSDANIMMKDTLYYFNYSEMMARISEFGDEIYENGSSSNKLLKDIIKAYKDNGILERGLQNATLTTVICNNVIAESDGLRYKDMKWCLDYWKSNANNYSYDDYRYGLTKHNSNIEPLSSLYQNGKGNINIKINYNAIKDDNSYKQAYNVFLKGLELLMNKFYKKAALQISDVLQDVDYDATLKNGYITLDRRKNIQLTNKNGGLSKLDVYKYTKNQNAGWGLNKNQLYQQYKKTMRNNNLKESKKQ